MKILKSERFGCNSLTPKLLVVIGVMVMVVMYIIVLTPSAEVVNEVETSESEFQTKTYLNASQEVREELTIKREDFEGFYFTLRLINPMRDRVVMIVNGTKLKTIVSSKYIIRFIDTIESDGKSPFYFIFFSYLTGSLYFPVGTVNFVSNSEGIWYNGVLYTGHPSIFRRICLLLSRDIK
ncbi:hypothetical protein [Encephalitozoon cuniculi GB-M1]|uniref:Uncharacterized protein n=1 Tax=Encephalitozoon cuniculi (strain GB-M1) TaxID=284813 RepID=Q8SUR7_ENCCU|nr:uncharacterized protein ECU08_0580 [Encephalitozoon cuniculi GB-M1]CAD26363.1 hypothetical protein [Encephalitozoon cuniculi GB-M1]